MHHRADIDALRGLSVAAVVLFHAWPGLLPGGFAGVDVFFVISGFLITALLLRDADAGGVSLRGFYVRRIRRLFPALVTVLAACIAIGWVVLTPDAYASLGRHVLAGAAFGANLLLWHESGYFAPGAEQLPLLHLWSLGIEEQFYLLWPPLLLLARRAGMDTLRLTWIAALLSLAGCIALTQWSPTAAFYLPLTRFWELLAGGVLAHAVQQPRGVPAGSMQSIDARAIRACLPRAQVAALLAIAAGLALIATACIAFDDQSAWPGWRALLPVCGALLVIAGGAATGLSPALRPWAWLGLVSYPLYLWHWPLLVIAGFAAGGVLAPWMTAAVVAASLLLAIATFLWIERPLRTRMAPRCALWILLPAMLAVAATGAAVWAMGGVDARIGEPARRYAHYGYDFRTPSREGSCSLTGTPGEPATFPDSCVDPPGPAPLVVLWGDSHAALLYPGLRAAAGDQVRLAQFTRSGCRPYLERAQPFCVRSNAEVLARVRALSPQAVVLFAHWTGRGYTDPATLRADLAPTLQALRDAGVPRVVVVGPAPKWNAFLPQLLVRQHAVQPWDEPPQRSRYGAATDVHALDAALAGAWRGAADPAYVSVTGRLCDPRGCLVWMTSSDRLTTWDYGHLAREPAEVVGADVLAALGLAGSARKLQAE